MAKQNFRRQPNILITVISYIFVGIFFWIASRWLSFILQPITIMVPLLAGIAIKAALEEILRLSITLISLFLIIRSGWNKKNLLYSIIASIIFAVLENANYLLAFPSSDIYIRAGYSSLIHANNAAIMALAVLTSIGTIKKPAVYVMISFLVCLTWHIALNTLASSRFINTFALPAVVFNCTVLLGIFFWSELIHFHKEEIDERT